MAILHFPQSKKTIENPIEIKNILKEKNVVYEQWAAKMPLTNVSTQEEILKAYENDLKPYMQKHGYQTADVINVHAQTPNILELRKKFLPEHTHSEDEVRFFVDGEGLFWFNFDGEIASLLCRQGDLISVPKNYKHWFDIGKNPHVKCIRIFTDPAGWVANYTHSKIEEGYNPKYD